MGPNERELRAAYAAFAIGDVDGVYSRLHPDVRWFVAGDPRINKLCGMRHGIADVRAFFQAMAEEYEHITHDLRDVLASMDERFCVVSNIKIRHKLTGDTASSWKIDLLRMKDGLLVEYAEHNDTAALATLQGYTLQSALPNFSNSAVLP